MSFINDIWKGWERIKDIMRFMKYKFNIFLSKGVRREIKKRSFGSYVLIYGNFVVGNKFNGFVVRIWFNDSLFIVRLEIYDMCGLVCKGELG